MTLQEALNAAIAGTDATIYAYGVAAGQLKGSARRRATSALVAHERWRDRWTALADNPPAPAVAYELPARVESPQAARDLAALVENRLVAVLADLAAAAPAGEPAGIRPDAARAAGQCAQRAVRWGAAPQAFPH